MRCLLLIPCAVLTACGSGSGTATNAPVHNARAVPGGTVEVAALGAGAFTVSTSCAGVRSAEVLRGPRYESAQPVLLSANGAGAWSGSVAPRAGVLVRLTLADGTVLETAPGDFPVR